MGQHDVYQEADENKLKAYMKALLDDLRALELMLETDRLESGVRRIGAEQEMFLVDRNLNPAPMALEVLAHAGDQRLTTEIARFNLEANLTPLAWGGNCLREMHRELEEVIQLASVGAKGCGAEILLTGILPTLQISDLSIDNLTPIPRYYELNRSVCALRGGAFNIHIKGVDELQIMHDNMMMESCNASFQIHLQVDEIEDELSWKSVLAFGTYEEITDPGERSEALNHLLARFSRLTPVESFIASDAGAPAPIVFRIRVSRLTGICEGG